MNLFNPPILLECLAPTRRSQRAAIAAIGLLAVSSHAHACLQTSQDAPQPFEGRLSALGEGTTRFDANCLQQPSSFVVWALAVDAESTYLGVRDDALFQERHTGPLIRLGDAEIGNVARVTVLARPQAIERTPITTGMRQTPHRWFGTICDRTHFGDPLDCNVGEQRIKMRMDAQHVDGDGLLDVSVHEISVYDGDARLYVISFITPYRSSPEEAAATWIDVLSTMQVIDLHPER
ncbi:MAG: hypothetical protein AAF661_03560 [Pseudomonadota bacterium]